MLSLAAELSRLETSSFASPPRGGFALVKLIAFARGFVIPRPRLEACRVGLDEMADTPVVPSGRHRPCTLERSRLRKAVQLMCGRYTNTAGVEELNDRFKVPLHSDAGTRRFNIAPTEEVLAIVAPRGRAEARLLRWGLIPPWASDLGARTS